MYCKDFNSLAVLSLFEGELIGAVDKLFFDKKLKKLCEIELLCEEGMKLRLNSKHIYNVGKNALTIKNNQLVELKTEGGDLCVCPIGAKAYSLTGEFLGVVQEIEMNEKYVTQKIILGNGGFLRVEDLASCGKNTMIFYGDKKVSLQSFEPKKPKAFKKKEVQVVNTMPFERDKEEKKEKQVRSQNANFLLGRICTKDIFNFNNELLIKANSVVNRKNLKEIGKFGKLKELMLYSK